MDQEVNKWAAILHVSQLAGQLIPLAGFIIPLVIWQVKKEKMPEIDAHGRQAMSWILSFVIYYLTLSAVAFLLFFLFFPFLIFIAPVFIVLSVLGIVFPIIAAVKASDGEVWEYPATIKFF